MKKTLFILLVAIKFLSAQWIVVNRQNGLMNEFITALAAGHDIYYIGTSRGVFTCSLSGQAARFDPLPGVYINDLLLEKDILWAATPQGLYACRLTDKTVSHFTEKDGLSSAEITCIAADHELVYIGTRGWGINIYNRKLNTVEKKKYTAIDGLPSNRILRIQLSPSCLFAACDNGFAWKEKHAAMWQTPDQETGMEEIRIRGMDYTGQEVFIASEGKGLYQFSLSSLSAIRHSTDNNRLPDDNVLDVFADGAYFFIATFSGPVLYNLFSGSFTPLSSLASGAVKDKLGGSISRIITSGEYVLIGTDRSGLFIYKKDFPYLRLSPQTVFSSGNGRGMLLDITGSAVSGPGISFIGVSCRDAEILRPFNEGITLQPLKINYFNEVLAQIDFSSYKAMQQSTVKSRLWNFEVSLVIKDSMGRSNRAAAVYQYDNIPPELEFLSVPEYTSSPVLKIRGKYSDASLKDIECLRKTAENHEEKIAVSVNKLFLAFYADIPLSEGKNSIAFRAFDNFGNESSKSFSVIRDSTPPQADLPSDLAVPWDEGSVKIAYTEDYIDPERTVCLDQEKIIRTREVNSIEKNLIFILQAADNPVSYTLQIYDLAGNHAEKKFRLRRDLTGRPVIMMSENDRDSYTSAFPEITLKGRVYAADPVTVKIYKDEKEIPADYDSSAREFIVQCRLENGKNIFNITARSSRGFESRRIITVLNTAFSRELELPSAPDQDSRLLTEKLQGEIRRLEQELAGMKKLPQVKTVYRNVPQQTQKSSVVPVPEKLPEHQPALGLVSFNTVRGDSIISLAQRTGGEQAVEWITLLNSYIKPEEIQRRRLIIIPNIKLQKLLESLSGDTLVHDLFACTAAAFFAAQPRNADRLIRAFADVGSPAGKSMKLLKTGSAAIRAGAASFQESADKNRKYKGIDFSIDDYVLYIGIR